MTSLRDALSSALESSEAGTLAPSVDTPVEVVATIAEPVPAEPAQAESAEAKEARVRDEAGRFAAKPAEVAQTQAAQPVTRKPPSSWKKEFWDRWSTFDPETQDYIDQREQQAASGVSHYKQQYDQVAPFHQALQPFIPTLQKRGITPDKWLQDLGHVDRVLSSGTPQEKAQLIHRMAAANGVQLTAQEGQGDPNLNYLMQTVNGLQTEVQSFKSAAAQQEQATLQIQIKEFADSHPHFEAVRPDMAKLLNSGVADSLQTAYDKAIRLNDETWQEHQALQAKEADAKRQAEIDRKKAAASSPRSASPTGALATVNGKKSLRETIADSVNALGGRV